MITTVTGKNQVTVPAKLAAAEGIEPGTRFAWSFTEREHVLEVRVLKSVSGYVRYDTPEAVALLNELYDRLRLMVNFVRPCAKLIEVAAELRGRGARYRNRPGSAVDALLRERDREEREDR